MTDHTATARMRAALNCASAPLTVRQIATEARASIAATSVAMLEEARAGRATRTGTPRQYAYTLTAHGRACANNPRLIRKAASRRHRARGPIDAARIAHESDLHALATAVRWHWPRCTDIPAPLAALLERAA